MSSYNGLKSSIWKPIDMDVCFDATKLFIDKVLWCLKLIPIQRGQGWTIWVGRSWPFVGIFLINCCEAINFGLFDLTSFWCFVFSKVTWLRKVWTFQNLSLRKRCFRNNRFSIHDVIFENDKSFFPLFTKAFLSQQKRERERG